MTEEQIRADERIRISSWMTERAHLIMQVDREGALELAISAGAIRDDKLGPHGMHADEPILQEKKS